MNLRLSFLYVLFHITVRLKVESVCFLCPDCSNSNGENMVVNVSCNEEQFCHISEQQVLSDELYTVPFKSIHLKQMSGELCIQLSWQAPSLTPLIQKEYKLAFLLKTIVTLGNISFCYDVLVPYEMMMQFDDYFMIPCINLGNKHPDSLLDIRSSLYLQQENLSTAIVQTQKAQYHNISLLTEHTFQPWYLNSSYERETSKFYLTIIDSHEFNCCFAYIISIRKLIANNVCDLSVPVLHELVFQNEDQKFVFNFSTEALESNRKYCVSVTSNGSESSEIKELDKITNIVFFEALPRCENWNGNFTIWPDLNQKTILVRFTVEDSFKTCFTKYVMYLFKSSDCDIYGLVLQPHIIEKDQDVNFKNVWPGNYCVKIQPFDWNYESCETCLLKSGVFSIDPRESQEGSSLYSTTLDPDNHMLIMIGIGALSISSFLIIAGLLWWRYKPRFMMSNNIPQKDIAIAEEDMFKSENVRVFILYSHDRKTKMRVEVLADFLQNCANFDVVLDENKLSEIHTDWACWISGMLAYKCLKKGDGYNENKRIIIIESERAVLHQQCCINAVNSYTDNNEMVCAAKQLHSSEDVDDEFLEEIFEYGLSAIMKFPHGPVDCCHLFVVRFDDSTSPTCKLEQFVPNIRYSIPDNLIDLCCDLWSSKISTSVIKKLNEHLKGHPILKFRMNDVFNM